MWVVSAGANLYFWWISCESNVSTTPFLRFNNSLEQCTEHRKMLSVCLLAHYKRSNSDSQMKGMQRKKFVEHGASMTPLWGCHLLSTSTFSPTQISKYCLFMEVPLHRPGWLNHWPLVTELDHQPPPLPRGPGWAKISNSFIMAWSF